MFRSRLLMSSTPKRSCKIWGDTLCPIQRIMISSLSEGNRLSSDCVGKMPQLTNKVHSMSLHEEMAVPHKGRQLNVTRIWLRKGDLVVEVVQCHHSGVEMVHYTPDTHGHDFVRCVVSHVRAYTSSYIIAQKLFTASGRTRTFESSVLHHG